MITGTVPFSGRTPYDQQAAVLVNKPTPIHEHLDSFVPELQWVMSKALTKEPGRRYQTATDLLIDFQMLYETLQSTESEQSDSTDLVLGPNGNPPVARGTASKRWWSKKLSVHSQRSFCWFSWNTCGSNALTGPGRRLTRAFGLLGPPPVIESIVPNRPIDVIGNQPIKVYGRYFQGRLTQVGFPNGGSGELSGDQIQKQKGGPKG